MHAAILEILFRIFLGPVEALKSPALNQTLFLYDTARLKYQIAWCLYRRWLLAEYG